jgi:hypothetical protein
MRLKLLVLRLKISLFKIRKLKDDIILLKIYLSVLNDIIKKNKTN